MSVQIDELRPQVPFEIKDDSGDVVFRDALVFNSMAELRNASTVERQAMQQARYDAWTYAAEHPVEPNPEFVIEEPTPEGE